MLANFVLENANNPGTGTITLAGAASGRRTFLQSFAAGTVVYYAIDDGTQQEEGYGTLTLGPPATLTRNVLWNSVGTLAPLNFSGACRVYSTLPAERTLWANQTLVWEGKAARFANIAAATAVSDAARWDQVGWTQIGAAVSLPSGSGGAVFALPAAFTSFRVEWSELAPTVAAAMYARVSIDGGTTYEQAAGSYIQLLLQGLGNSPFSGSSPVGYITLTNTTSANFATRGYLELTTDGTRQFSGQTFASNAAGLNVIVLGGQVNAASVLTTVLVGAVNTSCVSGKLRLLGGRF